MLHNDGLTIFIQSVFVKNKFLFRIDFFLPGSEI